MLKNTIVAALGLLILLTITHEPATKKAPLAHNQAGTQAVKANPAKVATDVKLASVAKPVAKPIIKPVLPRAWKVATSPIGGVNYVNKALGHYQKMGLSKQGAAYLVGNFMGEMPSAFTSGDPCHTSGIGDGGLALGFGQWHPGRRVDMPCEFSAQLTWAFNTEMRRDTPALRGVLIDRNSSVYTIQVYLQKWERWGVQGPRFSYAQSLYNQL